MGGSSRRRVACNCKYQSLGKLRKPCFLLGTRASCPHFIEKCGRAARVPRGFCNFLISYNCAVRRFYVKKYVLTSSENPWECVRRVPKGFSELAFCQRYIVFPDQRLTANRSTRNRRTILLNLTRNEEIYVFIRTD